VINCAAYSNVEYAEVDNDTAFKVNVEGVSNLSSICRIYNTKFVHFSSDYIFDGLRNQPGLYKEDDKPNPLNYYGYTKMKSEEVALENSPNCLIFRLS
jgi:dTDP-4-dehydrorhamnose reductase